MGRTAQARAIVAKPDKPQRSGEELLAIVRCQARNPSGGPHIPTEEMRLLARLWSEIGASKALIARELGIDDDTLGKHYAAELAGGEERGVANVAMALYEKALRGDTSAQIFYLKAKGRRSGWADPYDADKPSVVVQLDVVKALQATFQSLRGGALPDAMPAAQTIEHAPSPPEDGRDLL